MTGGKGGNMNAGRLSIDAVRDIRASNEKNSVLADKHNVTTQSIVNIKMRRTWKNI